MISGVTVTVEQRDRAARDGFGNDVERYSAPVDVDDVLVVPGACAELDSARPDGVRVALTLHFPATWRGSLRGARVSLPPPWDRDGGYAVVGDPMPYMGQNCPTGWRMPVEVTRADG